MKPTNKQTNQIACAAADVSFVSSSFFFFFFFLGWCNCVTCPLHFDSLIFLMPCHFFQSESIGRSLHSQHNNSNETTAGTGPGAAGSSSPAPAASAPAAGGASATVTTTTTSNVASTTTRSQSSQRWMKLRTTVQLTSAIGSTVAAQKQKREQSLKREDSFIARFSTRQVPEQVIKHTPPPFYPLSLSFSLFYCANNNMPPSIIAPGSLFLTLHRLPPNKFYFCFFFFWFHHNCN